MRLKPNAIQSQPGSAVPSAAGDATGASLDKLDSTATGPTPGLDSSSAPAVDDSDAGATSAVAAPVVAGSAVAGSPVEQSWPSTFPHVQIDELMNRVGSTGSVTPEEASAVLGAILDEARTLRATVVRLTAEKLSAAEKQAEEIISAARAEATELRRSANDAMLTRLDEAETAGAAITQAAQVDATRRSRQGQQLLAQTRTEVEELRNRVSAIFDSTTGILPLLGDAADALGRMESQLAVGQPAVGSAVDSAADTAGDTPAQAPPDETAAPADADGALTKATV